MYALRMVSCVYMYGVCLYMRRVLVATRVNNCVQVKYFVGEFGPRYVDGGLQWFSVRFGFGGDGAMAVVGLVWVDRGAVRVCAKMSVRAGQARQDLGNEEAKNCKERRVTSASRAEESDDDGRVGVETAKQAGKDRERTSTNNNTLTSREAKTRKRESLQSPRV